LKPASILRFRLVKWGLCTQLSTFLVDIKRKAVESMPYRIMLRKVLALSQGKLFLSEHGTDPPRIEILRQEISFWLAK
jgi:hypothetical protein